MAIEQGEADFARAFERESRRVLRALTLQVGWVAAEELTAETFTRAWRAWPRFSGDDAACRAWLLRIATNLARDHHRRRALLRFVPLGGSLIQAGDAQGTGEVQDALTRLHRKDRELLAWRAIGLTYEEIASMRRMRVDAVRVAWSRAAARLKTELGTAGTKPATEEPV